MQLRVMPLFSTREHPNTLAPLAPGELWVMLHNLGEVGNSAAPAPGVRTGQQGTERPGHAVRCFGPAARRPVSCLLLLQSDVVRVDLSEQTPREALRIKGAGTKAHGLVEWRGRLLLLDSEHGALAALDRSTGHLETLWQVRQQASCSCWYPIDSIDALPCG